MALEPQSGDSSLVNRVKKILLEPKAEWERIDVEPATVASIFRGWVMILAAIPALGQLVGSLIFGTGFGFGFVFRPTIGDALVTAATSYILSIVSIFVLSLIIDALAPTFGGTKNSVQSLKVAAYSMTAAWVAGIFYIIPQLVVLAALLGALYSLYLLYLGLPRLMKAAEDKAVTYTVAVIVAAIVIGIIVSAVTGLVTSSFMGGRALMPMAANEDVSGTMTVPGVGTVDLGKMNEAAKKMEAASQRARAGAGAPVQPATLLALLPQQLAGFQRTELSSVSAGAGGIGGSSAEARYKNGDHDVHITVTDISAVGALAAMGSALNVQSSRQTQTGYERTETIGGRMTSEKWDSQSSRGSYSVLVADRFMVEAEGKVPSIQVLRGAVDAVGLQRLEALKG